MRRFFCFFILVLFLAGPAAAQETETLEGLKEAYLSARNRFMDASTKKFSDAEQAELDAILEKIRQKDAQSFEYHLVVYLNSNYNTGFSDHLFKAYALKPGDDLVNRELFGYYLVTGNTAKQKEFAAKIYKTYSTAELAYYKDAMPTESSAILVTSGQEDMYAYTILQLVDGIGPQVNVICLDFLKNDSYRAEVAGLAGVADKTFLGAEQSWIKSFITGSAKSVQVSVTVPQAYLGSIADNMVLTGLTYRYSSANQRSLLDRFWTLVKSKDPATFTAWVSAEKKLYSNYLPPLLTLYRLTVQEGTEDVTLKTTIRAIAEKTGKKETVEAIINQYSSNE